MKSFKKIENTSYNSLAILHLKYDKYKDDALDLGLVSVENEQIKDVIEKNPYEQKMLFIVAPKEKYFPNKSITLQFDSNLYINNTGKSVRSLQINFNNENGDVTVKWNTPINYSFSSSGIKDIYFRIIYTDNSTIAYCPDSNYEKLLIIAIMTSISL